MDMGIWEKSECYYEIIGFINAVSVSVQGKMISHVCEMSPCVIELLKMFDVLNKLVEEAPVIEQPQRFGNKAYRTWFANMKDVSFFNFKLFFIFKMFVCIRLPWNWCRKYCRKIFKQLLQNFLYI